MMDHIIEFVVGGVVTWILLLETRLRSTQGKLGKLEEMHKDEQIAEDVHSDSDSSLDSELSDDLSSGHS